MDVYYRYTQIASHARSRIKYQYTTNAEHLASQHCFITESTPEKFLEQAYKSCNGILSFIRRVGPERLADACRRAESIGQYNYPVIDEILRKRLDQLRPEEENIQIPSHENIRGKEYYQ